MQCPACDTSNPPQALHCMKCGKRLGASQPRPAAKDEDRPRRPREEESEERRPRRRPADDSDEEEEYERRPRRRPAARRYDEDDDDDRNDGGISTLIPYKNPRALFSYYCGIAALIPILGLLFAPFALVLGILGLLYRRDHPQAKGTAHAVIGVVLGGLSLVCYPLGFIILMKYGSKF